jgi:hypothetical protein
MDRLPRLRPELADLARRRRRELDPAGFSSRSNQILPNSRAHSRALVALDLAEHIKLDDLLTLLHIPLDQLDLGDALSDIVELEGLDGPYRGGGME